MLAMVRDSYKTNQPIVWNRVHNVPDYVYFNHSVHINKGVGCTSCHGQVDQMALVAKAEPMTMEWCLECHRNPEQNVRPRDQVFNMAYKKPANQTALGEQLVKEYHIPNGVRLSECYICHR